MLFEWHPECTGTWAVDKDLIKWNRTVLWIFAVQDNVDKYTDDKMHEYFGEAD